MVDKLKVAIIGAGISGLTLQYFLLKRGIEATIIDQKKEIGYPIKDTGLVSNILFKFFRQAKEIVEESFNKASIFLNKTKIIFSSRKSKMYLIKRAELDKLIFSLSSTLSKPKIFLKERVIGIKDRHIITQKRKVDYDILVGADGTFSKVANTFKMNKKTKFIFGEEAIFKLKNKKESKRIEVFFSPKYSNEYFLWKIFYNNKLKIGYLDTKRNGYFWKIVRTIKGNILYSYSDFIKIGECDVQKENVLLVGEAASLLKPFTLGGINYGIISSYLASIVIKKVIDNLSLNYLKEYKSLINDIFSKSMLMGKVVHHTFKKIKNSRIMPVILKITMMKYFASFFHPDFFFSNLFSEIPLQNL